MHPERDMGRRIAHNVASASVLDYLELADEHSIVELKATEKMAGKSIIDLDIRAQYGINIIAIKRGKEFIISPNPNINLEIGDILIMIGHDNDLNRFEKILRRDNREWDRNDIFSKFISSSHPNLQKLGIQFLFVGTPQLALPVEFLFEILYVGPIPNLHVCKLTFRQLLCWGP